MPKRCDLCTRNNTNFENCKVCDGFKKNYFRPMEHIEKYFKASYSRYISSMEYNFDSLRDGLKITTTVNIHGSKVCPYCGNTPYLIEGLVDINKFKHIGYMCLCEKSLLELEFKKREDEINQRFNKELSELRLEFKSKLVYNSELLLKIEYEEKLKDLKFIGKETYFSSRRNSSDT